MTVMTRAGTTGRRKEAVARVRLVVGTGRHLVNERPIDLYLTRDSLVRHALHALTVTQMAEKFDLLARVRGGGLTGQAGALRMAIARALAREDETLRPLLSREGLLTRDARMKERKKYGQPGARKRFQFSKR
ncbi:MAG: 30S ribosomal protein S9 [Candidatus Eisenbacteria bacterium]|uniref:Small ribosomal subunit protein uS9 n=1 Tax=Eiseniibacteriota bacterium TaxID=2212470 RepID=A0A538U8U2_UNCEI|nr:MAG: 30S ribosomal protein S9 [Candidatus Eisenbacteria bacterium]